MNHTGLQNLVPGFAHEAYGSQAVFRTALNALSHPGRWWAMPLDTHLPPQGQGAAAALLLGLVDTDTAVWLSPRLAGSEAATWLRFHTGCTGVTDPRLAQFLWVALGDAMPDLRSLRQGSDTYPDQSATCVLEVERLQSVDPSNSACWTLQGPGMAEPHTLQVQGLTADFVTQWAHNHASFPCGVDVFLTTDSHIAGLPRTTRLSGPEEV